VTEKIQHRRLRARI